MIRLLLHTQLGIFLCYGIMSGIAISAVINYKCKEAAQSAQAEVYIEIGLAALTQARI